nr:MAG TPA: hypothetical protein [Caudoviricetes sp.]
MLINLLKNQELYILSFTCRYPLKIYIFWKGENHGYI